ncbi:MAG: zinc-binding dehydrogenase [Anaerolineales bacterium]
MRSVIFNHHGGPEVLVMADMPIPIVKKGHALVKLSAAALNRMDIFVRNGWPGLKLELPHIPGADGAGEILALGDETNGWNTGDHVVINSNLGCGDCEWCKKGLDNLCTNWHLLGETVRGTYTEIISIPVRQLYKLPQDFSYEVAAASGLVFLTAWHSLITKGKLSPGETVLIIGASGGVNTASIQIAKFYNARVIVVGSTPEKLELAESLGADNLVLRTPNEDWSKTVYNLTSKKGVDIVVDNVGTTFPLSLRSLRKGGRLLTVGNTVSPRFEIDNRYIFGKHLTIIGSTMGTISDFSTVMDLITTGKLHPAISKVYPLSKARQAHEHLESGKNLGKVVLSIAE